MLKLIAKKYLHSVYDITVCKCTTMDKYYLNTQPLKINELSLAWRILKLLFLIKIFNSDISYHIALNLVSIPH